MFDCLLLRIVPDEIVVAASKVDVALLENCGPLEGCSYLCRALVVRVYDNKHLTKGERKSNDLPWITWHVVQ